MRNMKSRQTEEEELTTEAQRRGEGRRDSPQRTQRDAEEDAEKRGREEELRINANEHE